MPRSRQESKDTILKAAQHLLKRNGATATTIDAVSREAGCAKGLVHYHFLTKPALLASVAAKLGAEREAAWGQAFKVASPEAAIELTWNLLAREAKDGTIRAWTSLLSQRDQVTGRAVREQIDRFAQTLSVACGGFLDQLGLRPTVPIAEVGWLLASVVHGTAIQLGTGADAAALHGGYAAAWLGVLAMASPV